jgi:hypothetical protein
MKTRKPAWWQLYVLVPIMSVLLVLEHLAPLPRVSDQAVDAGIVLVAFGAMLVWSHLNAGLLEWNDMERYKRQSQINVTVYEPDDKTNGDEQDHTNISSSIMTRPITRLHGTQSIEMKEEGKWFLN